MYKLISLRQYNERNHSQVKLYDDIDEVVELLKEDKYYHSIIENIDTDYILYFDVDGCDNIDAFINKIILFINSKYYMSLDNNSVCYTKNNRPLKEDSIINKLKYPRYHLTIPSVFASLTDQKNLCKSFLLEYPEYKFIYDISVYNKNGYLRLPNQSKGKVEGKKDDIGIHIIEKGSMQDFILENTGDVYLMDNVPNTEFIKYTEIEIDTENTDLDDETEIDLDDETEIDNNDDTEIDNIDYIRELLEKFPYVKFYNGRASWLTFLSIIKSLKMTWQDACKYSQKMPNHSPCTCQPVFKSITKIYDNPVQKLRNLITTHTEYTYVKTSAFDFKSTYDIFDFKEEFYGRKYDMYKEMKNDITLKLMSVCAYIMELECFVLKSNNNIKTIKNIKNCLPRILLKGGEDKYVECNLQKFVVENTLFNYTSVDYILNIYKNNRIFNIWKGYNARIVQEIDKEVIDITLDLLLNVFCNNDVNLLRYTLTWFSNLVSTSDMNKVALVLVSEQQGAGKGTFLEFMTKILGSHCCKSISGITPLTQKHNTCVEGRRLVIMNEAASTREEFRSNFDKLKSIITDPTIEIEPKGLPSYEAKNIGNYIIVSNHKDSVVIENNDRRYQVLECSGAYANKVGYFAKVRRVLQIGEDYRDEMHAANSFYTYLMNYNDKVDLFTLINTPLRQEMQERSLPNTVKFIKEYQELINDLEIHVDHLCNIRAGDLYQKYKDWATKNTEKIATGTKFGTDVKSYITKTKRNDGLYYVFTKN